jgi:5'-3' exonuclease
MGIPSFYRQLCRRFPTLITKTVGPPPEWLCLDFNCAMYYVLNKMPPISGFTEVAVWEEKLCRNIAAYMGELSELAAPTKGIYVSCDGAVCAAKRRQQRLRRFKGPWATAMEARFTGVTKEAGWDQNALTPGSAFMAQLGDVLVAAGSSLEKRLGIPVTVSTTKDSGEGEHKLMTHMRLVRPVSCTIYGLDADLILLAMLLRIDTGADVRLMREAQAFESGSSGEVGWRSLDVDGLAAAMLTSGCPDSFDVRDRIRDFVCAMSLLGNDFLPRSLTHTVRDDGIPELIATLQSRVWSAGLRIVDESGSVSRAGLIALLEAWAENEERDLVVAGVNGRKAAARRASTPEEEWNNTPARWASVSRILDPCDSSKLIKDWRGVYGSWRPGHPENYVRGVAWVWDYYSGRAVDQGWMFDEHLPPLWSDVLRQLRQDYGASVPAPPVVYKEPLPDWLHLFAVLPAASVNRLLPPPARRIMARMPYYWPESWSVFDVGKTQMWECEPVIPMIPEHVLRKLDDPALK